VAEPLNELTDPDVYGGVPVGGRLRFAALSVPTFRWYWIASWISSTGDGMENVIRNLRRSGWA